jgi:hypothetical protein
MDIEGVKRENIIDMALGFSSMTRVFEKKSTEKIVDKLALTLSQIASIKDDGEFQNLHVDFCRWFVNNVRTAERKRDRMVIKESAYTSYGQGAKVLDVALKVYVYYCHLPDPIMADRVSRWLHAAIDTKMLKYLRRKPGSEGLGIKATSIEDIDSETYTKLQKLVREDIKGKFSNNIIPVQWDDIIWRQLNRSLRS